MAVDRDSTPYPTDAGCRGPASARDPPDTRRSAVEIKDYLRALGKRAWVVILVPVVAGALALGYQLGQKPQFQSTVTVLSHPASAAAGSVIQYITSFQAAMGSDTVINQVAQQAGLK